MLFVMMQRCLAFHHEVLVAQCKDAVKVQNGEVVTVNTTQRPQKR